MTVTSTTSRWDAVGNGSTTVFPYNNKIFANSDLKVYLDGVLQTLTTHYTVSGAGLTAGGNVTFVIAPANGVSVVIVRDVTNDQQIDYPPGGAFPAASTEDGLDRRTIVSQQNNARLTRALRYRDSDAGVPDGSLPALADLKGKILRFDASTGAPDVVDLTLQSPQLLSRSMAQALSDTSNISTLAVYHGGVVCFYEKDASGTALTTVDGQNWSPVGRVVTVQHWGYTPDGVTSCSTEARAAVVFLKAKGGGVLYLPAADDEYAVDNGALSGASWDDQAGVWVDGDNIHIVGDGPGATNVKLLNSGDAHVFKFGQRVGASLAVNHCSISNMTIDGNRANQTAPTLTDNHWHAIDFSYGGKNLIARNLHIKNCVYYAIGFQRLEFIDCLVEKVIIEDVGADGIDMKDDDGTSRNNTCRDVVVRRFGLIGGIFTTQAGINPRGGWTIENCQVFEFTGASYAGIRVERSINTRNPYGNRISKCVVDGGSRINLNRGIVINGNDDFAIDQLGVSIDNCHVSQVVRGYDIVTQYVTGNNLFARACTDAFVVRQDNVALSNIQGINSAGSTLVLDGNNIDVTGFLSAASDINITIESGASNCRVRQGLANTPITSNIVDNGSSNFSIEGVNGIDTRSSIVASCAVDSTGDVALEWVHLLDKAPLEEDVWFTLAQDTAVTDYEILGPIITNIDATKVYATVTVKTASSTGGAAVNIYCHSETYKASRY